MSLLHTHAPAHAGKFPAAKSACIKEPHGAQELRKQSAAAVPAVLLLQLLLTCLHRHASFDLQLTLFHQDVNKDYQFSDNIVV